MTVGMEDGGWESMPLNLQKKLKLVKGLRVQNSVRLRLKESSNLSRKLIRSDARDTYSSHV